MTNRQKGKILFGVSAAWWLASCFVGAAISLNLSLHPDDLSGIPWYIGLAVIPLLLLYSAAFHLIPSFIDFFGSGVLKVRQR